jgi:hypothetical protein
VLWIGFCSYRYHSLFCRPFLYLPHAKTCGPYFRAGE